MTNPEMNTHMEFLDDLIIFVSEHGAIRGYSGIEIVNRFDAIRAALVNEKRLKKKVGELQELATDICEEPGNSDLADRLWLIQKFRDFDFGGEELEKKNE